MKGTVIIMGNVVLYCEKLPTVGMETLISELCPPELDLRFLFPVKNGKKGDYEDADYILGSIKKIGRDEIDRAKNLKLIHVPATGYNHVDTDYAKAKGIPVYPVVDVEVSSASHPFRTGRGRVVDTEGRVARFNRRYGHATPGTRGKRK